MVVDGGGGNFFLKVYKSDPFRNLSLGAQYALTVMALPVPEQWERFYHSEIFSTRCKIQKPGTDRRTHYEGVGRFGVRSLNLLSLFSACAEKNGVDKCNRGVKTCFMKESS